MHVLFECPAYQHIKSKYGRQLFSRFGRDMLAAVRVLGKVPEFMNQEPRQGCSICW